MARPFLTADWHDLLLVNYRAPVDLLERVMPPGVELDTPDGAGDRHLVSLVAFTFANTRVFGVPLPTAQRFGEVNVRFYTRLGPMRAATFVREFVPSPLVVAGARLLYRQPYSLARIGHEVTREHESVSVRTTFQRGRISGAIEVEASPEFVVQPESSEEHFLKEHYWGFDRGWGGTTYRYRVDHPVWRTNPVRSARIGLDPGMLIGREWAEIDWSERLESVLLAEGSRATVYTAESLPNLAGLIERGRAHA
jgi:uncharacterized protein